MFSMNLQNMFLIDIINQIFENDLFIQLLAVQIGSVSINSPQPDGLTLKQISAVYVTRRKKKTAQNNFSIFSEKTRTLARNQIFIVNSAPAANISIHLKRSLHILDAVMLLYSIMSS